MKTQKIIPHVFVHALSHDGRGVAAIDGKTVFIHNALPNEKITCQIIKSHRRYDEGKAIAIEQAVAERALPACAHYGVCGGCSMQHIALNDQIKFKQQILLEQLQHFGKVSPENLL